MVGGVEPRDAPNLHPIHIPPVFIILELISSASLTHLPIYIYIYHTQPAVDEREFEEAERVVKENPDFQAALARRGITVLISCTCLLYSYCFNSPTLAPLFLFLLLSRSLRTQYM